ncbi:uncharacterized protein LOC123025197 [Varanus komodoensis]|uniref:uncharacterized protein LOC123025197 n=1 Tax=Varanus komodoensis TaxID=61221 RepID=UPI001CF7E582|nr:uncharacterized protein LOC123025197 [Varanus komodoensis]
MGRLDDQAKRRIVELRKAGLSFRKIKKVLELDNIRVTPQAIYLFLKRKNVEPSPPLPAPHPLPLLEKGSQNTLPDPAGWEDNQLWKLLQGHEARHQKPGEGAGPAAGAAPDGELLHHGNGPPEGEGGIKIVSVTSLSKDGEQQGSSHGNLPVGSQLGPSLGDNCLMPKSSLLVSCSAPVVPAAPLPNPHCKGKAFLPPARNPALIVKRKIVGRAIHLQKKTTDAVTQTPTFHAMCSTAQQNSQRGGPLAASLACFANPQTLAEKLDMVHTEVQKLAQAMHVVLERQCQLERQQEQQQRFQQEVLMTLQQLSSTISQGAVPANPPCAPYGSLADPSPSLPNFSQFKMELI